MSKKNQQQYSKVRIIGGKWRGKHIYFPNLMSIRPTPDRVRETLFNWLRGYLPGAKCLDLFAGSGAVGLEALSRGAGHLISVDRSAEVVAALNEYRNEMGLKEQWEIYQAEALNFLANNKASACDLVFLDPPFGTGIKEIINCLVKFSWLAPQTIIYLECPIETDLNSQLTEGWGILKQQRAGAVQYALCSPLSPES